MQLSENLTFGMRLSLLDIRKCPQTFLFVFIVDVSRTDFSLLLFSAVDHFLKGIIVFRELQFIHIGSGPISLRSKRAAFKNARTAYRAEGWRQIEAPFCHFFSWPSGQRWCSKNSQIPNVALEHLYPLASRYLSEAAFSKLTALKEIK